MSDGAVIRCERLAHVYPDGTRALDGIDIEIEPGERIAIAGPNGAVKTTLVRHWNGLLRPTAGSVSVGGRPTAARHVAELARIVGLTFQDPSLQLFASTCQAEVAFGARNAGLRGPAGDEIVAQRLAEVGLGERRASNPYDLGPSKRRLLAIASVLAMSPAVLVLDEPTIGLDDDEVALVARLVRGEADRGGAVVAITHDPRLLAGATFEREVRMDAGRVVADGPR